MSELKVYGMNDPKVGDEYEMYKVSEVDAVLAEKDAKIHELENMPHTDNSAVIDALETENEALKKELEDNVDFWKKENRRLKRALYKACAMWADRTRLICSVFGSDAPRIRWERMLGRCRAMAEKFK